MSAHQPADHVLVDIWVSLQKARDVYQQLTETSLDVWDTLIQKYILQALLLQQQVQLQAR